MSEKNEKEYTIAGRKFKMSDFPDYVGGMPPDPAVIHDIDYLDEIEKIWGRKWGAQGIGQLKEVALVMATDHENHDIFYDDIRRGRPTSFARTAGRLCKDIGRRRSES